MLTPRAAFLGFVIGTVGAIGTTVEVKHTVDPHDNYYHLSFNGTNTCGGTAIGPHALLTADHCFSRIDNLIVGKLGRVTVRDILRDRRDHVIIIIDKSFVTWDDFGPAPRQTDSVAMYHGPGNYADLYSKGYMSGRVMHDGQEVSLYDLPGFFGSSGSAILDKDNKIVGVVSKIVRLSNDKAAYQQVLAYDMDFTPQQLSTAAE